MKKSMFTIIAIIIAILICWANLHAVIHASNWINAGIGVLIVLGVVALLHVILMALLIIAAQKLSLGSMLAVWGLLIFLSFLPMLVSHFKEVAVQKQEAAKEAAHVRIDQGVATMNDFEFLYEDDEDRFLMALRGGYREFAEEILAAVCNPSSDRIFGNYVVRLQWAEKYGKEVARQKILGWWLVGAVEYELPEGVEMLLAAGANVNEMTEETGGSPLMAAAQTGQLDMIRLFIQQGADVNLGREESGERPLMAAVERGQLDAARLLLQLGADVNAMDGSGIDALFKAVVYDFIKDRIKIAELLIEHGADTKREYHRFDNQPHDLLYFAQKEENSEMIALLTSNNRPQSRNLLDKRIN